MIEIRKVESKEDLKAFVKFPFRLYKNSPYWVPPLINDEMSTFDTKKNPVFKDAEAQLFLAFKGHTIVGRVAAIINWIEVNKQHQKKMRFGWCDFIDDLSVSKALLNTVEKIGMQHQLAYCEGPVGFSNLDKVGVITEGFDSIASMITWYNYAYYQSHYETHGYAIEKTYNESKFAFTNVKPSAFKKAQDLIKKRYKLTALTFTKTKQLMPYADKMFDLFNESYANLSSFVEITEIQKAYFKKKFMGFVNPEYVKFVVDEHDNLVAFAIVMPKFANALQKAKGKLFPLGLYYILKDKRHSKDVLFYLIGVHPEYQNKGVHAVIFNEYYDTFTQKGITMCYRTPELADNASISKIWKHFDPEIFRKRSTFKKVL